MKIIIEVSDKMFHYATTLAEMTIGTDLPEGELETIIDKMKNEDVTLDLSYLGDKKTAQQMIYGLVMVAIGQKAEEMEKEDKT